MRQSKNLEKLQTLPESLTPEAAMDLLRNPQVVGTLEHRAVASAASKAASLDLLRQLSAIDVYDFMRRVGAYLTVRDFKPNGYAVETVFEYDDKIARVIKKAHRVRVRLKITAESLLYKE